METSRHVAVIGAGKIGGAIARMLSRSGDYQIGLLDINPSSLEPYTDLPNVTTQSLDLSDPFAVGALLYPYDAVISACGFQMNAQIAQAAAESGVSYFDLTEDVASTQAVRDAAQQAVPGQIFMPQCGLAPGFVGILAADMVKQFDEVDSLRLRVGALPLYPDNRLKYNLSWSTEGLINEYCNPCDAIESGQHVKVLALEGLEHLLINGVEYEAFNTSGGLGMLCETFAGRVKELNYKTLRYPGHCELMLFLIHDLGLGTKSKRELFRQLLEDAIPHTDQDKVVVRVSVTGKQQGVLREVTDTRCVVHGKLHGDDWSAIQLATASGACAVVDLFFEGELPTQGFVKQEQVPLALLLRNRFGCQFQRADESMN